jgi:TRAP-type C4-dicarboxylate transport system substrate-binding protein
MAVVMNRLAVLVLAAVTMAGCGFGGDHGADKAGGSREPLVLRLANTNGQLDYTPTVVAFVDRVEELSGGDLRVEAVDEWGNFANGAEQQVVKDVAAGAIDLGWVGTRVFDTLDVKSFQALTAPMLIDSYSLQSAVIESGITEQMMRGIDDLGVAGLGVLPDGLRKPTGVSRPIVSPADWQGITFGTLSSNGQAEAIRALGAMPEQVHRNEREERLQDGTLQGFETSIWIHQHNPALTRLAPYMTSNVTLWPQMDVLIANPARLEALTGEQRGWLTQAARDAAARSAILAATDARALTDSCTAGARFAEASDADLAALRRVFQPVYAGLRRQPETREFLARIEALKQSTPAEAGLTIPTECTGKAPTRPSVRAARPPSDLNGTYRWVLTQKDADKVGDRDTGYPHVNTITLKDGRLDGGCFGSDGGTYSVQGDRITFHSVEFGDDSAVSFSRDEQGNLHLEPLPPIDAGGAFECFYKPWIKID